MNQLFSSDDAIQVDFNKNQAYEDSGLYLLDEDSYVLLVKEYLSDSEINEMINDLNKLEYKQMQHKTGTKETRCTHHIGPSYSYGDITHDENHKWPVPILKTKARLEVQYECPLNSTLINRYEKHQFIPYHADDEDQLAEHPTVFSISVGDTRNIHF